MSTEEHSRYKNAFWWITSIAVSVLCCSVLFVLFASYLVDLKADIKDNMMHVNAIEDRQNQILAQLQSLAKRVPPAPATQNAVAPTGDQAPPAADTTSGLAPEATTPPSSVTVPVIPATPDKP